MKTATAMTLHQRLAIVSDFISSSKLSNSETIMSFERYRGRKAVRDAGWQRQAGRQTGLQYKTDIEGQTQGDRQ